MTKPLKQYRVPVDFPEHERGVLDVLCDADLRPAAEQIRWLVLNEAKRRGVDIPQPMHNRAGEVLADSSAVAS